MYIFRSQYHGQSITSDDKRLFFRLLLALQVFAAAMFVLLIALSSPVSHADSYREAIAKSRIEPGLSRQLQAAVKAHGLRKSIEEAFIGFDAERTRARLTLLDKTGDYVKIFCDRKSARKWDCSNPPVYEP